MLIGADLFKPGRLTLFAVTVVLICSNQVLELSTGIDDLGSPRWHLALCLLFCWILTFVALIRGVKSAGKVRLGGCQGKDEEKERNELKEVQLVLERWLNSKARERETYYSVKFSK